MTRRDGRRPVTIRGPGWRNLLSRSLARCSGIEPRSLLNAINVRTTLVTVIRLKRATGFLLERALSLRITRIETFLYRSEVREPHSYQGDAMWLSEPSIPPRSRR
jgi:hypothetical protein